ncbi:MAG: anaerobic magnesium-protoporphyrin IX monomethyl ester cyclase [Chlamydiales bacterium]|jgi:anaerobic magnesium-protoporphyrin IX monomethyl ester cyclase
MRVLFIYPNLYTQMGFNHGLASLSAVLLDAGHETRLVNLNEKLPPVLSEDGIVEMIRDWEPGLIGFSCLTMQYEAAADLARGLRAQAAQQGFELPPLVVGGIHPTMVPDEVMSDGVWDHVGMGECEDALLELVTRYESGAPADDVPNFLSWPKGERPAAQVELGPDTWVRNAVGEFPDLCELPEPDYGLFDTGRITEQKHGWFGLLTSRGCPYRCTYCLNHKIVDLYKADLSRSTAKIGFFRFRPVDKMLAEVRGVLERYPQIGTFILDDDLFTVNVQHALDFCAAYEASGIGVPFVVNSHVKRLDPRVAQALSKAGCKILKLGIESGSQRVRTRVLKRHMTQADIFDTVAAADEFGLHTSGFVMVGLPTETRDERWETVDTLAQSRIGRFRTSFFYPFPGTEGFDLSLDGGYIKRDVDQDASDFTDGSVMDFGAEENLFIDKLGKLMPWFVNSRLDAFHDAPAARHYQPLVERVLAMDRDEWEAFKPEIADLDRETSAACIERGELHYAIRYNRFMGVRSDFFLAEDAGIEWLTAAAPPAGDKLQKQAIAAAAAAAEMC